jgi:hypothetical protein
MARLAARAYAVLIAAVVAFQMALVAGAPWGEFTQGGASSGVLPLVGRLIALVSALVLVVLALAVLGRAAIGPWKAKRRLSTVLAYIAVAYGVVAIVANAATPSAGERIIWLPVSLALLTTALVAVLGSRRPAAPR